MDGRQAFAHPLNQTLAAALRAARWTPRDLVRALNPRLEAIGRPTLHLTAGRAWLNGSQPRCATARRLAATVLTEATGVFYSSAALWGDPPANGGQTQNTATDDLVGRRSVADVLDAAANWVATGAEDQAVLHPASESQLLSAVWDATRQNTLLAVQPGRHEQVPPAFVDVLESQLARLRRLDDTTGGGKLSQRYVRMELAGVLDLVRNSRYTSDVGNRLLATASGMAQLAGWMAFDADLHAAAQRYQLFAIRLARAADESATVANALGMLAYQHAATGKPVAALRYAEAAVDQSARSSSVVRARAWGRMATAYATAGEIGAFREATDRCRALLERRRDDDPHSLYYYTPEQVAAETGHALVELAVTNPARARPLLAEATALLSPLAQQGPTAGFRRSALLHGIHLARAHLMARDPESTASTLLRLTDCVEGVQSIRCRNLLRRFRGLAGTRMQMPDGTRVLTAVDTALSTP
ncbi:hypothetical protein HCN56_00125 [Streptomyces lonarensis]|uniref:Transcriptional regulator n=1 Tax=Streptomyces lonarensis TaxID=700599 RepID=A0A7X6CX11_9ACTN|nr:hypothetical protein [Streptomyces lonarensis]